MKSTSIDGIDVPYIRPCVTGKDNRILKRLTKQKRWPHPGGKKYFYPIEQMKKDTYICFHFVGQKGPTEEHPDPVKVGDVRKT